jgi:HSP20 family protein
MRYRRLSYRYALVLAGKQPLPWDETRPLDLTGVRLAQTFWRPPADVCESAHSIEVVVDLAGIDQNEVDVLLYEDALIVEGRRHLSTVTPKGVYHVAEIRQGPFRLELTLPVTIDQDRVHARYDGGLLHITLPKQNQARRSGEETR